MPSPSIPVAVGLPVPPDTLAAVAARAAAAVPETPPAELGELLRRILALCPLADVWLFGSRARGDYEPASDWDLLVVVPDGAPDSLQDPSAAWRLQQGSGVHADVIICTASEFGEDVRCPNTLAFAAGREGILLHAR